MSQIQISDLTFYYEGSADNIFERVSFSIDTDWKLGFIGRNGKGKTTFLRLLTGGYEYQGTIAADVRFCYFPYPCPGGADAMTVSGLLSLWRPDAKIWRVLREFGGLGLDAALLYRPFYTLSSGEQTKVMLAVLFSGENDFLLIDEPTNHLDAAARETVKSYLSTKRGFILVSHDRSLLNACTDHVLVLNRRTIEVACGNFQSWWENKAKRDAFAQAENEKHLREIDRLKAAARRTAVWADRNEATKIGFDPIEEHDRFKDTRAFLGAKTKKLQSRAKSCETRLAREIAEKEGLLRDIETVADLKLAPLPFYKETLLYASHYGIRYRDAKEPLFSQLDFEIRQGERVFLRGRNGCGKSSLIRAILAHGESLESGSCCAVSADSGSGDGRFRTHNADSEGGDGSFCATGCVSSFQEQIEETGTLAVASGLVISYVNQDPSFLGGTAREFCARRRLDEALFFAILQKLGVERSQFCKPLEDFSEGQKKKVLLAASLATPAHLYIWDEPLNYIDVFSRMQIEALLTAYKPTMLLVEHDAAFMEKAATRVVEIE